MGKMKQSEFYCCKCGKKGLTVQRKSSKAREAGHLKKLFCIYCGEEVNHAEIDSEYHYTVEDFMLEFKYNNFDENQQRRETLKSLKAKLRDGGFEEV